jgi:hypothetical protein
MNTALKAIIVVIAFVAFSQADVEDEALSEKADIEYRISFKTKDVTPAGADFTDAETAQRALFTSTGKFTIEIIGADGTTGPQDLIDHPSMTQADPPNGPWEVEPGMVQVAKITAPEVGDITEIRIEGDNNDKWSPGWVKVNSNDFHSGLGNGIFYTSVEDGIKMGSPFNATTARDPEHPTHLHKCVAQFCKKAEHRYLMEGDDEPPENEDPHNGHGGMFGPLGEGMPGTERDHTMTRGHFMREFLLMGHLDDDDEDFLRTHIV